MPAAIPAAICPAAVATADATPGWPKKLGTAAPSTEASAPLTAGLASRPATADPSTPPAASPAAPPPSAEDTNALTADLTTARACGLAANPFTALVNADPSADTTGEGLAPDGDTSELTAACTVDATPRGA